MFVAPAGEVLYRFDTLCRYHSDHKLLQASESDVAEAVTANGRTPLEAGKGAEEEVAGDAVTATETATSTQNKARLIHDVLQELKDAQRSLWDKMQYQVSLLVLSWRVDDVTDNEFYHCVFLVLLFITEGDYLFSQFLSRVKLAESATGRPSTSTAANNVNTANVSRSLRNTVKTICHQYLEGVHRNAWSVMHSFLLQDSWQRVPVVSSAVSIPGLAKRFQILKTACSDSGLSFAQMKRMLYFELNNTNSSTTSRSSPLSSATTPSFAQAALPASGDDWAWVNLFAKYDTGANLLVTKKVLMTPGPNDAVVTGTTTTTGTPLDPPGTTSQVDPILSTASFASGFTTRTNSSSNLDGDDSLEEDNPTPEKIAALLETSPVLAAATMQVSQHVLHRLLRLLKLEDTALASEVFLSLAQLFEYYAYGVCCIALSKADLKNFLANLRIIESVKPDGSSDHSAGATENNGASTGVSVPWPKVFARYRSFLLQRHGLELRQRMLHVQDYIIENENFGQVDVNLLDVSNNTTSMAAKQKQTASPVTLLAEKCVAVESCIGLLRTLSAQPEMHAAEPQRQFLEQADRCVQELRTIVYYCAARDLLYVTDEMPLDSFCQELAQLDSSATTTIFFDQMRAQFQDFGRRIPCCGGGSLPQFVQSAVWTWVYYHFLLACTDVLAREEDAKKRNWLTNGFTNLVTVLDEVRSGPQQKLELLLPTAAITLRKEQQSSSAGQEEGSHLLVVWEQLRSGAVDWQEWCRKHSEYPLELHVNLLKPKTDAIRIQNLLTEICTMAQSQIEK
ncbi:unnamed protein product [Amoebophrya sp. A120]|nr:unnamed protein product [Amoebophrya sp. A120]|eukprot:GSA120T00011858001.1